MDEKPFKLIYSKNGMSLKDHEVSSKIMQHYKIGLDLYYANELTLIIARSLVKKGLIDKSKMKYYHEENGELIEIGTENGIDLKYYPIKSYLNDALDILLDI